LASSLSARRLANEIVPANMPALIALLEHQSVDVRTACGTAIALLLSARKQVSGGTATPPNEPAPTVSSSASAPVSASAAASAEASGNNKGPPSSSGGGGGIQPSNVFDRKALVALIEQLATDGQKHRAKKDRVAQRYLFRDVLATIQTGEQPFETVKIGLAKYDFHGWPKMIQLQAIRESLAEGFLFHLTHNELLADIFDISIAPPSSDPLVDKEARKQNIARAEINKRAQKERNEKGRQRKNVHLRNEDG